MVTAATAEDAGLGEFIEPMMFVFAAAGVDGGTIALEAYLFLCCCSCCCKYARKVGCKGGAEEFGSKIPGAEAPAKAMTDLRPSERIAFEGPVPELAMLILLSVFTKVEGEMPCSRGAS